MGTLIAIGVLLIVPILLGIKTHVEYGNIFEKPEVLSSGNKLAIILLVAYIFLIVFEGKDGIYKYSTGIGKYFDFFILPSFGFGLAIFPHAVAEYSKDYVDYALNKATSIFAIPGWLIIIYLAVIILVN